MVPMCWGGGAGYGTHVLGWSSWLWYPCVGVEELVLWWRSWLWYPCVVVEELVMVPMCCGGGAGYMVYPCVGEYNSCMAMVPMCCGGGITAHISQFHCRCTGIYLISFQALTKANL